MKTPVLFVHGENDNDVPIEEAEQFYIALHDVGVETMMLRYPREGHGLRETRHIVDALERRSLRTGARPVTRRTRRRHEITKFFCSPVVAIRGLRASFVAFVALGVGQRSAGLRSG